MWLCWLHPVGFPRLFCSLSSSRKDNPSDFFLRWVGATNIHPLRMAIGTEVLRASTTSTTTTGTSTTTMTTLPSVVKGEMSVLATKCVMRWGMAWAYPCDLIQYRLLVGQGYTQGMAHSTWLVRFNPYQWREMILTWTWLKIIQF